MERAASSEQWAGGIEVRTDRDWTALTHRRVAVCEALRSIQTRTALTSTAYTGLCTVSKNTHPLLKKSPRNPEFVFRIASAHRALQRPGDRP